MAERRTVFLSVRTQGLHSCAELQPLRRSRCRSCCAAQQRSLAQSSLSGTQSGWQGRSLRYVLVALAPHQCTSQALTSCWTQVFTWQGCELELTCHDGDVQNALESVCVLPQPCSWTSDGCSS